MAYNGNLKLVGPQGKCASREIVYPAGTDTLQEVLASGYFNDALGYLQLNDRLVVIGHDKIETIVVSSEELPITTKEIGGYTLNSGSPGNKFAVAYDITGGASTFSQFTLVHKMMITDVQFVNVGAGAAGDTVQLQTNLGVANITEAVSMNGAAGLSYKAINIPSLTSTVAAGANIRVKIVAAAGAAPSFRLIVTGISMA